MSSPKEQQSTTEEEYNMMMTSSETSDAMTCPLFMDGLPSDFADNHQLAALASLMESDRDDKDDDGEANEKTSNNDTTDTTLKLPPTKRGGGKLQRPKGRRQRQATPYSLGKKEKPKPSSSMGEAQLFLKMWKL